MDKSRYILRQINLINFLLAGVLVFFIYMLSSLVNAAFEFSLPVAKPPDASISEEGVKAAENTVPYPDDYAIITDQNLFHPDRKIVASAKGSAPLISPDFVLYGTLITDNTSMAFLEDLNSPYISPGRGKRQRAISLGTALSGYTLKEIYHDIVVMVKGEERIEVRVSDSKHKRAIPTKPVTPHTTQASVPPKPTAMQPQQAAIETASPADKRDGKPTTSTVPPSAWGGR